MSLLSLRVYMERTGRSKNVTQASSLSRGGGGSEEGQWGKYRCGGHSRPCSMLCCNPVSTVTAMAALASALQGVSWAGPAEAPGAISTLVRPR